VGVNTRIVAVPVLVLVLVTAAACDADSRPPAPTTSPAPRTSAPPTGCARPPVAAAAAGSRLVPGPSNGLRPSTAGGDPLVIDAVVLERDCTPAVQAQIHVWHADAHGLYGPANSERCCYYDGDVSTDAAGRFRITTIRPAQYPVPDAPPAHIHLEIRHPAANLGTEIIFGSEPATGSAPPTSGELSIVLTRAGKGWRGEAVFVLAGVG